MLSACQNTTKGCPRDIIDTAFVHCWILPGGALKVLTNLIKLEVESGMLKVKDSCLFTLTSDRENLHIEGIGEIKIVTALPKWLNNLFQYFSFRNVPVLSFFCDYRNLMLFYPLLMKVLSRKVRRYQPRNIIISSFAVAKNIDPCKARDSDIAMHRSQWPNTKLYLHSPMQYIRSHHDDYLKKLSGIKLWIFKKISKRLRQWDKKFRHYDEVVANSHYTANLAKEIYGINAQVQYPHIAKIFLDQEANNNPHNYYLYVGRLTKLVREADTIIHLFNKFRQPLLVMGSGPDEIELQKMAGDTIIFLGWIEDAQERINIFKNAKGLINLTKESFGIGTAEALLLGVPVFGLDDGASPELVDENCGLLVSKDDFCQLEILFKNFMDRGWDRKKIAEYAKGKFV